MQRKRNCSYNVVGQVPIPDTAKIVCVKPIGSTAIRIGLEAPEAYRSIPCGK
jgi:hypothetical protein